MVDGGTSSGHSGGRAAQVTPDAVLEQMPVGVIVAEAPSGRVVRMNPQVERIWGEPLPMAEDFAGYSRWPAYHADGRPYQPEEWPLARAVTRGEVVAGEEMVVVRGDGSRRLLRVGASPVRDPAGCVVGGVMTLLDAAPQRGRDVARRVLAEASSRLASSLDYERTLRNVVRLLVPALADWCTVDLVNDAGEVERLIAEHADPGKAELAREMERSYPPRTDVDSGVGRALRTGRAEVLSRVTDEFLQRVARDQRHLEILRRLELRSVLIVPLLARGRTLGALVLGTAGSGRTYGPEDLETVEEVAGCAALAIDNARLYLQSQAANRAKADFLAVISHELRTPLTAIIGYAELLGLGVPEPISGRQREQVERIEIAARHLAQLIDEILTMTTLETGRGRIRPERIPASELLHRALVLVQPLALAKGLDLRLEEPAEDPEVETDPDKLVQVLVNLLGNAVKFTDHGQVRLAARREGDLLEIIVRDTGVGIAPEHMERIFEPFWQVEQPITRKVGGTGLGLTIARRLLRLLGGDIRVESVPGQGSVFIATVPLRMPDERVPLD